MTTPVLMGPSGFNSPSIGPSMGEKMTDGTTSLRRGAKPGNEQMTATTGEYRAFIIKTIKERAREQAGTHIRHSVARKTARWFAERAGGWGKAAIEMGYKGV